MTNFKGACHCGRVRFELRTDEPLGPYFRCNCSLCSRKGAVMGQAALKDFVLTQGQASLTLYRWNTGEAEHWFCSHCGIYTHHVMRGATDCIGVNMACIEGVNVFALPDVVVGGGARLSLVSAPEA